MSFITIGEFAERTRLSPKALRIYSELGLVVPARVDPSSGYQLYAEDQVDQARIVGLPPRHEGPVLAGSPARLRRPRSVGRSAGTPPGRRPPSSPHCRSADRIAGDTGL
jgi:hypothetical protein